MVLAEERPHLFHSRDVKCCFDFQLIVIEMSESNDECT